MLNNDEQLEKWQSQQHKKTIESFIRQMTITAPIDDIYFEIFSQLQNNSDKALKQIDLSDVLFIAKQLQIQKQWNLKVHFEQKQLSLTHADKKLSYWRRELYI